MIFSTPEENRTCRFNGHIARHGKFCDDCGEEITGDSMMRQQPQQTSTFSPWMDDNYNPWMDDKYMSRFASSQNEER
jgi:hypothetical protein